MPNASSSPTHDLAPRDAALRGWPGLAAWAGLLLVVAFSLAVRVRVADVPLERDEGEYAYVAQRMLAGEPPYAKSNTLKWPGIFLAYAAIFLVGGESIRAVHLGLAVTNAATIVLLFLLVRRWRGPLAAVLTAAVFALLALNVKMQGIVAQPEHFVVLLVVGALVALDRAGDAWPLSLTCLAGIALGAAIVFKQHAAPFVLLGPLFVWRQRQLAVPSATAPARGWLGRMVIFFAGVAAPLVAMLLAIQSLGVFDRFWEWTVAYAADYTSFVGPALGWVQFKFNVVRVVTGAAGILTLAAVGLAAQFFAPVFRPQRAIVLAWLIAAGLALSPGLLFRDHYFLYLTPVVALLTVDGAMQIGRLFAGARLPRFSAVVGTAAVTCSLVWMAWQQRLLLYEGDVMQLSRAMYTTNPFPEAVVLGEYLREHSRKDDLVAVLGSEPEIYFYAQRRNATEYLYMYPLMEPHANSPDMQRDLIAQIEAAQPKFLVYVQQHLSWLPFPTTENHILPWFQQYRRGYDRIALAERSEWSDPLYRYGDEARRATPRDKYWIEVLERRDEP